MKYDLRQNKKILLLIGALILAVFGLLVYFLFSQKNITKISNSVVGNLNANEKEIRYFIKNDIGITSNLYVNKKNEKLFTINGNYSYITSSWSPDYRSAAISLLDLSVPEIDAVNDKKFFVMSGAEKKYESSEVPDSFVFTENNELIGFYSNQEDWTLPGSFKKLNIDTGKMVTLKEYETTGVLLLYKTNLGVVFVDIDQDSGEGSRDIKELNVVNKTIEKVDTIDNLVDAEYQGGGNLMVTKYNNNTLSVVLKNIDTKKETRVSENNYGKRFTTFKDQIIGFFSDNYLYGEQDEQIKENIKKRDSLRAINDIKNEVLKGKYLNNCYSPRIISKREAFFVCSGSLYRASGSLF